MMHAVRRRSADDSRAPEHMAYKIAQVAADPVDVDPEVADMVCSHHRQRCGEALRCADRSPWPATHSIGATRGGIWRRGQLLGGLGGLGQ